MKRYPLLIQLVLYFFLFILLLFGLLGSLYYQTSQGRSASKQSGRQEIVSIKAVSSSPPI